MKFVNVKTGLICEPHNELVIAHMRKSDIYKELEDKKVEEQKEEKVEETKETPVETKTRKKK